MDLITLQEYKSYNMMTPDTKEDAKIQLLISSVSSLIQAYLGFDFEGGKAVSKTISLDYDTDTIYLDDYPIEGPVSISETDRYTWDSTVHVPLTYASDYNIDYSQGIIRRIYKPGGFAKWPISPGLVTISYMTAPKWDLQGGATIPADLKLAAIELVSYYRKDEFRQSKNIGGTTIVNNITAGSDFPKHIQVLLDRYK